MIVREDIREIYEAAIDAVNPQRAVESCLKLEGSFLSLQTDGELLAEYNLAEYKNIYIVGSGKATASMAKALENIFGKKITEGVISVKYGYTEKLDHIRLIEASHPVPDENSIISAREINKLLLRADKDDLVISLISGGGSSLLTFPPENITLNDKIILTNKLLRSGASIDEINCVRKHISLCKGGGFAKSAYPATIINLVVSDVIGDDLGVIASGPFEYDNTTFQDASNVIIKYNLQGKIPESIINYLKKNNDPEKIEEELKYYKNIRNLIISSNIIALKAAKEKSIELGYNTLILSSSIYGDTEKTVEWHIEIANEILKSNNPIKRPACILTGGETTVFVKGDGLGGRNMEFVLHSVKMIDDLKDITIASIGTDGTDGPTDSAGAIADGNSYQKGIEKGFFSLKYLERNDSYNYFKKLDDLIITGPTNTNVMDIRIICIK